MAIGTGLLFAVTVLNYVTGLWETLLTVIAAVHLIGWALVTVAALRGELNAARPKSTGETAVLEVAPAAEVALDVGPAELE